MNGLPNSNDQILNAQKRVIDPRQARVVAEFRQSRAPACCQFDHSGQFLFVGSEENDIQQWNFDTGEKVTLSGHESWVRDFAFPRSDETFVSAGYDGNLIWWARQPSPPRRVNRVKAHRGWIRSIAISGDGRFLVSGGNDRIVRVWSMTEQKLVGELPGHQYDICSVAFHPDGEHLASADARGIVKMWSKSTWQQARELDASATSIYNKNNRGFGGGLRNLVFSSDGRQLIGSGVVGGGDPLGQAVNPGAIVFDWMSGEMPTLLRARGNEQGVAWGLVYHPIEQFVAAVSGGLSAKHVYFWKTNEEQPFHVIDLPSPGRSMALHPDGMHLAVAQHDGRIQIYALG